MKKLKNKVFSIIFILLTVFTLVIIISSTVKNYIERRNSVSEILTRIPNTFDNMDRRNRPSDFVPSRNNEEDSIRIFLDFTVYTIILDDDGNYKEIINNTFYEELNE